MQWSNPDQLAVFNIDGSGIKTVKTQPADAFYECLFEVYARSYF
jgi:hypothetical protein